MKKLIVGVAAALSLVTSNAIADGPYRRPPPTIAAPYEAPPPPPTWTGFYIGAGVGAAAVLQDVRFSDDFGTFARLDSLGSDGAFGTVIIGWDWQISPKTVFGVFTDYDFTGNSRSHSDDFAFSHELDNVWSVGARLGWLSNPGTLWYVTGGYTQARFDHRFGDGDFTLSHDRTFNGWFAGGGVDTRLAASNWFLRLEYRFSQFDSDTVFPIEVAGVGIDSEPRVHSARVELTYKFGSGYGWGNWGNWGNWGQ